MHAWGSSVRDISSARRINPLLVLYQEPTWMLTCFQAAGSATCTGVKGKETHKEEEKKQRNSFELSHPSWWEEKPQFPSLSPQGFGVQCCCLLAGCLLFHK